MLELNGPDPGRHKEHPRPLRRASRPALLARRTGICLMALLAGWTAGCGNGSSILPPLGGPDLKKEGGFTILLATLATPDHVEQAKYYKKMTEKDTGWDDLYIVHEADHSSLYRGKYSSADTARIDLEKAKEYVTPVDVPVFAQAMIVPLPGQDIGPAEWNLKNVDGAFTVVVAEFYNDAAKRISGRKQYAVDNCRDLREKGQETYFYHGPVKSLVCIGNFPEASYPAVTEAGKLSRVIRDPRIHQIFESFPNLAVNGYQEIIYIDPREGRKQKLFTRSYLMAIPKEGSFETTLDRSGNAESR